MIRLLKRLIKLIKSPERSSVFIVLFDQNDRTSLLKLTSNFESKSRPFQERPFSNAFLEINSLTSNFGPDVWCHDAEGLNEIRRFQLISVDFHYSSHRHTPLTPGSVTFTENLTTGAFATALRMHSTFA